MNKRGLIPPHPLHAQTFLSLCHRSSTCMELCPNIAMSSYTHGLNFFSHIPVDLGMFSTKMLAVRPTVVNLYGPFQPFKEQVLEPSDR